MVDEINWLLMMKLPMQGVGYPDCISYTALRHTSKEKKAVLGMTLNGEAPVLEIWEV